MGLRCGAGGRGEALRYPIQPRSAQVHRIQPKLTESSPKASFPATRHHAQAKPKPNHPHLAQPSPVQHEQAQPKTIKQRVQPLLNRIQINDAADYDTESLTTLVSKRKNHWNWTSCRREGQSTNPTPAHSAATLEVNETIDA